MKRIIPTVLIFILCSSLCAEEPEYMAIDQPLAQLEFTHEPKEETLANLEAIEVDVVDQENDSSSETHALLGSFQRFIRIFLILLNSQKVQSSVKAVEGMLFNLIQTAFQVMRSTTVNPQDSQQEIAKRLLKSDPTLKRAMTYALTKSSLSYNPIPICKAHGPQCCHKPKQADKNAKIVLENFAQIASHFINILQDPNDSERVGPNLMGMLSGIINIGTQVIKSGPVTIDSSSQEIAQYVENIDPSLKLEFATTISKTLQRTYCPQ